MILKVLVLVLSSIVYLTEGLVKVHFSVTNYENSISLPCGKTKPQRKKCYPFFKVCLGTAYQRCNIVAYKSSTHYKDTKKIKVVYKNTLTTPHYPDRLRVNIQIWHFNTFQADEIITKFENMLNVTSNFRYNETLHDSQNISVLVSLRLTCVKDYYGPKCNTYCKLKQGNYVCGQRNGQKKCILKCKNGGKCQWNRIKMKYRCNCSRGWIGRECTFPSCKTYCSNRGRCESKFGQLYCICQVGYYGSRCENMATEHWTIKIGTFLTAKPTKKVNATQNNSDGVLVLTLNQMMYLISAVVALIVLSLVLIFVFWRWRRRAEEGQLKKRLVMQASMHYNVTADNCSLYGRAGDHYPEPGQRDSGVYEEPKETVEEVYEEVD